MGTTCGHTVFYIEALILKERKNGKEKNTASKKYINNELLMSLIK